jgi:hypothetical protein
MDAQTSLPQNYEDPQEVSIKVQQRLEAKNLKNSQITLTDQTDVSGRHYTGAFLLTKCDKMCSPVKPVIKVKVSVHFNIEHFFYTLTSCVHRLNRRNSKRSSVDHQRLVQTLRKCTHRLNQR